MKTFSSSRLTSTPSSPLNSRWTRGLLFSGMVALGTGCGGAGDTSSVAELDVVAAHAQALISFPSTCANIRAANPIAVDGDYVLYVGGDATRGWLAWCQDMASTPLEYLTLPNLRGQANYSEYFATSAQGTTVRSTYTRLRINPTTLVVNTSDQRFAISMGSLNHGSTPVTSMPFASAMACNPAGTQGRASIDLRGTPFTITAGQIVPGGTPANGSVAYSNYNQTASLLGGGNCGWESLQGAFNPFNQNGGSLQLQFVSLPLPATCADIHTAIPSTSNGAYLLYVANDYRRPWAAWCQDMASTPLEYLALPGTSGQSNFSEYLAASNQGTTVRSTYTRLRINPTTLVVNTADQRFATSTGSLNHGSTVVTSMPFATAMSCNGIQDQVTLELRGTPFTVPSGQLAVGGAGASGSTTYLNDNQTVKLQGGGWCGWDSLVGATNPYNQNGGALQLAYVPVP